MVEGEPPAGLREHAPLFPAVRQRDEVARVRELDVHRELVLEAWDGAEDSVLVRDQP